MKAYAATLAGHNPAVISTIYQFDSESIANDWVEDEVVLGTHDRTVLNPQLAKKVLKFHRKVHVRFEGDWKYQTIKEL